VIPRNEAGLYTSGSLDEHRNEAVIKVVNDKPDARPADIRVAGMSSSGTAKVTTLASADLNAENSFDHPRAISPQTSTAQIKSGTLSVELPPYSVSVYRIAIR